MRRTLVVAAAVLALPACGSEDGTVAVDKDVAAAQGSFPTAIPAAAGPVSTDGLVTVLDDGDGPELCTFVAESYPPQCSGTPVAGWKWAANPKHEDQSGTRWGSFALTGTFDGTTFTVTDAIPAALYDDAPAPMEWDFETPCDEPSGGWTPVDPATTTQETMDATFVAASRLPGYAGAWIDQSLDDAPLAPAPGEEGNTDPLTMVINVAVTTDPAGAEATLRETWGGALCVSEADHTEAELTKIAIDLQKLPGVAGVAASSASGGVVDAEVLYDDGSLQAWVDETYGKGRVEITSTLVPLD